MNMYGRERVTTLLEKLEWEELAQRRLKAQVTMTYKILNGLVCIPPTQFIPIARSTRSHSKGSLRQLMTTTDYYKNSFYPTAIRAWNTLPVDVTGAASILHFRSGLNQLTIDASRVYK